MASGETYTRLREQSFTSSPCFKRVKTKTRVSHHPHPSPATTLWVPPRNTPPRQLLRSPLNFPRLSTPDQTFKVEAALAGKERRAETGTHFALRPPSLFSLPSPPLPFPPPTEREPHNQLFILFQQRERGRELLSTATGRAPSLALQTSQEISGETRLLQAQGFQRSSPYPHLPGPRIPRPAPASGAKREGAGRRGWTLRGSEKPAPGKMQTAEMLAARRLPPQAPCGES